MNKKTTIILIRHGLSQSNKLGKFTGQTDVPLDETGIKQAGCVSRYVLKHYKADAVYSSDLIRAQETVRPIAEGLGLTVIKCRALREIDAGIWENMRFEDIKKNFPEMYKEYNENTDLFRFEGGESFEELKIRSAKALRKIAEDNPGKTVVIGTHGGTLRSILSFYKNIKLSDVEYVSNCSITTAEYENGKFTFIKTGYCDYLDEVTQFRF